VEATDFHLTFTEVIGKMKMIKEGKVFLKMNLRVEARTRTTKLNLNSTIDKKVGREDNLKK